MATNCGKCGVELTDENQYPSQRGWRSICKSCNSINNKKYGENVRLEIFNHYGSICKCCGEHRKQFLCIDHINGGGAKHRKEVGNDGGVPFYRWLIKNNFPEEFQILCYNCNMSKGAFGYCPHELENDTCK